jgi:O-antigen/teichoic acid export membrane protein
VARKFFQSLFLLLLLNTVIKPIWIFAIDRKVQLITGTEVYGKYFALFSLSLVFNFLIDFGITVYYNRKAAADNKYLQENFARAAALKLLLSVLYAVVLLLICVVTHWDDWRMPGWLIVNQVMLSFLLFFRANITAMHEYTADAFFSVLDKLLVVIGSAVYIYLPSVAGPMDIYIFIYLQVAGASIAAVGAFVFVYFKAEIAWRLPKGFFHLAYLKETIPYAIAIFLMAAHSRLDAFLLERMHSNGAYEAGVYAKAFRLLDAANMAGYLTAGFMLPYLSKHLQDPGIKQFITRVLNILMLLAIFISSVSIVFPEWIDRLLYHQADRYTSLIISLCIPVIIFYYWVHVFGSLLTASGLVKQFAILTSFFVVLNFVFNLFFVSKFGAQGSAIIALGSQCLYCVVITRVIIRNGFNVFSFKLLLQHVALFVMVILLLSAGKFLSLNIILNISSVVIITLVVAFIMKMISFRDLRLLISIKS